MAELYPEVREILEKFLESIEISEYTLTVEDSNVKGNNYLSLVKRIAVKGKKNAIDDVELKWIAKCAPQVKYYRELTRLDLAYEREIFVYKELFPIFDKFQKERIFVTETFQSYPKYIASYFEPYKEIIVLKDMKEAGFLMKGRKELLDLDHVKLVMRTYGKLHAVSYAIKEHDLALFEYIKSNMQDKFFASQPDEQQQEFDDNLHAKAIDSLDPERNRKEIEIFRKYSKYSARIFRDVLRKAYDDEHSVVCHGDSWITNMLYKYGNNKFPDKPTEVCLLDFQLSRFGSPAFDLSYFLFTCTDQSFRKKYYDQMINTYYYSLCSHLVDMGYDPMKLIPFNVLQKHLKKYSVFGYGVTKAILFLMTSDTDEIPDIKEDDTESDLSKTFVYDSKNESVYKNRIGGVIEDFVSRGYFDFIDEEY